MLALTVENARLRALLAASTSVAPKPLLSQAQDEVASLRLDLQIARTAQSEAERKLRESLTAREESDSVDESEDLRKELDVLKTSLASIATDLELERERAQELAALYRQEQVKVAFLQQTIDDLRKPLPGNGRRPSVDAVSARRVSLFDSTPRRRSSLGPLGPATAVIPQPVNGVGLGLAVDSPSVSALSTSPLGKPTPLHRLAQRRASASLGGPDREEDDRRSKLRDLRFGTNYLKVASRRGSLASGLPDFSSADDFVLDYDGRRRRSSASYRHGSISEEGCGAERPPSAPLRAARKNSMAVFEDWSRRSSTDSSMGAYAGPFFLDDESEYDDLDTNDPNELRLRLEGLKIQLAEAEEGRRASELCLRALKDFIAQRSDSSDAISLPPMPVETGNMVPPPAPRNRASFARWSIPRFSFSSRSGSPAPSNESPNLTTYTRRPSNVSLTSVQTSTPFSAQQAGSSKGPAPSFGAFSFAALAPASTILDGDTSPRMSGPSSTNPDEQAFATRPHDVVSSPTGESQSSIAQTPSSEAPSLSTCSSISSRSASPGLEDENGVAKHLNGPQGLLFSLQQEDQDDFDRSNWDVINCDVEGEPRIFVAEALTFEKTKVTPSLRPSPSLKRRSGLSSALDSTVGVSQGVTEAHKALSAALS
ncbi:hypothetical protein OIV83_005822 [Microbotryomycetes sp. JL201]|nr:hypothetical protein OIV83_005822 [Microbotryomycetes sp. JL201]